MSSPLVNPPVVKAKPLFCPNCGGPVEVRGFGHSLSVVCPQCLSVLDTSAPMVQVLQQFQEAQRRNPLIPLGSRGKLDGATWELIGFQTRAEVEDGETYEWSEYLLFNPYKGFRYLVEYEGHWTYVTPLESLPSRLSIGQAPAVFYGGHTYKHFSGAEAATTFVLGEFPWRVRVDEKVICDDYVDPPRVLSSETTDDEVTWSQGIDVDRAEIWTAFGLQGAAPAARGVSQNQPSPYAGKVGGIWSMFFLMLGLVVALALFFAIFMQKDVVLRDHYHFDSASNAEPSFVTKTFDLDGRTSTLELNIDTDLRNDWAYFNFSLINQATGEARDFGREVSNYSGTDSDGAWSEGSPKSSVLIPQVPPGKYYLWVEPEMDKDPFSQRLNLHSVSYDLELRHDVPNYSWFWITAVLLLVPPVWYTMRARAFEARRWINSNR